MPDYKNQHTVSKGYLKRFTRDTSPKALWRYDKHHGTVTRSNVDRLSVWPYAYSVRDADGKYDHTAEKALGRIEDASIPLFHLIEAGHALTQTQRRDFSSFMAAMARRNRGTMEAVHHASADFGKNPQLRRQIAEDVKRDLRGQFPPEEIEDSINDYLSGASGARDDNAIKSFQLDAFGRNLIIGTRLVEALNWQILKAPPPLEFLTSDAPAFVRPYGDPERRFSEYIPIGSDEAELHFPLSPRYFLLGSKQAIAGRQTASPSRVKELNARVTRMAHRYVYMSAEDVGMKNILDANSGFSQPELPRIHINQIRP